MLFQLIDCPQSIDFVGFFKKFCITTPTREKAVDFYRRLLLCLVLQGAENGSSHNSTRTQGESGRDM